MHEKRPEKESGRRLALSPPKRRRAARTLVAPSSSLMEDLQEKAGPENIKKCRLG